MIKVIINADDLGLNHQVNEAIGNALRDGHITSSTILANSSTWDEVHQIVVANPQASFGIHLNLTEGKALTYSECFIANNVVDENNHFTKEIRKINITPEILNAIYEEWDAQLNKVINIEGIQISHIDGHHHIHQVSCFSEILIELIKKYNIRKIRNKYTLPNSHKKNALRMLISQFLNNDYVFNKVRDKRNIYPFNIIYSILDDLRWKEQLSKFVSMTDYFDSYESFLKSLKNENNVKFNSLVELMCHPGHPLYKSEFEQVRNHEIEESLRQVEYISFNDFNKMLKE